MGTDGRRPEEYLSILRSKEGHDELSRGEIYRSLYEKATALIREGHNPFVVAMALSSLTSVILGGIDDCARKRST
jgi:hypothetical protein